MNKIIEKIFYECKYCSSVFDSKDMAEIHVGECLHNYDDVHTCVSCKHACINLVAPTDLDNGYSSLRLQGIVGTKAYLTCSKNIYNGKLTEEKILREDKKCYEQMEEGEQFIVNHTDSYTRYKGLIEQANEEEKEINESILEYHSTIKDLKEQGYSEEEAQEFMKEKYKDE